MTFYAITVFTYQPLTKKEQVNESQNQNAYVRFFWSRPKSYFGIDREGDTDNMSFDKFNYDNNDDEDDYEKEIDPTTHREDSLYNFEKFKLKKRYWQQ